MDGDLEMEKSKPNQNYRELGAYIRVSKVQNLEGEILFNFVNNLEEHNQILVSAKVLPAGALEIDMSGLPLDFAPFPRFAEKYIKKRGKKISINNDNANKVIKSEDGDIEFVLNQQTTIEPPNPVYAKIKLAPPVSNRDSILDISHLIALTQSISEEDAKSIIETLDEERRRQAQAKQIKP